MYASVMLACAAIVALAVGDVPFLRALPPVVLGAIVALGLLTGALFLGRMWDLGHGRWRGRGQRREVLAQLDKLSTSERDLLVDQITKNEQTFGARMDSLVAAGLRDKGLARRSDTGHPLGWPHIIPDFVWIEMQHRWGASTQPKTRPGRSAARHPPRAQRG